mmetsp:Transcript_8630/g.27184  ORF Transcript_8630/g.27184 Transcript_8630/m.27184 type:complete len:258 (+) Transcript_8630:1053-1826(+)
MANGCPPSPSFLPQTRRCAPCCGTRRHASALRRGACSNPPSETSTSARSGGGRRPTAADERRLSARRLLVLQHIWSARGGSADMPAFAVPATHVQVTVRNFSESAARAPAARAGDLAPRTAARRTLGLRSAEAAPSMCARLVPPKKAAPPARRVPLWPARGAPRRATRQHAAEGAHAGLGRRWLRRSAGKAGEGGDDDRRRLSTSLHAVEMSVTAIGSASTGTLACSRPSTSPRHLSAPQWHANPPFSSRRSSSVES